MDCGDITDFSEVFKCSFNSIGGEACRNIFNDVILCGIKVFGEFKFSFSEAFLVSMFRFIFAYND